MSSEMTMLCGFGMSDGGAAADPVARHKQVALPIENATVQMDEVDGDAMLLLTPAGPLMSITIALPAAGADLQMWGVASMADIASVTFSGGIVLNAPMELLANQAVLIQRIAPASNTWITIL